MFVILNEVKYPVIAFLDLSVLTSWGYPERRLRFAQDDK